MSIVHVTNSPQIGGKVAFLWRGPEMGLEGVI